MSKLKPCPFCGGEAEYYTYEQEHNLYDSNTLGFLETYETTEHCVGCEECLAMVGPFVTKKQAIKAWNTRAYDADLLEKVKPLIDAIEHKAEELLEAYDECSEDGYFYTGAAYRDCALWLREIIGEKNDADV